MVYCSILALPRILHLDRFRSISGSVCSFGLDSGQNSCIARANYWSTLEKHRGCLVCSLGCFDIAADYGVRFHCLVDQTCPIQSLSGCYRSRLRCGVTRDGTISSPASTRLWILSITRLHSDISASDPNGNSHVESLPAISIGNQGWPYIFPHEAHACYIIQKRLCQVIARLSPKRSCVK